MVFVKKALKNKRLSIKKNSARRGSEASSLNFPEKKDVQNIDEDPEPVVEAEETQKPRRGQKAAPSNVEKKGKPAKTSVKAVVEDLVEAEPTEEVNEESPREEVAGKRIKKLAKAFTPGSAVPAKRKGRPAKKVNELSKTVSAVPTEKKKERAAKESIANTENDLAQMNEDPFEEKSEEKSENDVAATNNETPLAGKKRGKTAKKATTSAKETTDASKSKVVSTPNSDRRGRSATAPEQQEEDVAAVTKKDKKVVTTPNAGRRGKNTVATEQPKEDFEPEVEKALSPQQKVVGKRGKKAVTPAKEEASSQVSENPVVEVTDEPENEVATVTKEKKGGRRGKPVAETNTETAETEAKDDDQKKKVGKTGKAVTEVSVPKETKARGKKQAAPVMAETEVTPESETSPEKPVQQETAKPTTGKRGKKAAVTVPVPEEAEVEPSVETGNDDEAVENLPDTENDTKLRGRKRKEEMPAKTTKVARKAMKAK